MIDLPAARSSATASGAARVHVSPTHTQPSRSSITWSYLLRRGERGIGGLPSEKRGLAALDRCRQALGPVVASVVDRGSDRTQRRARRRETSEDLGQLGARR